MEAEIGYLSPHKVLTFFDVSQVDLPCLPAVDTVCVKSAFPAFQRGVRPRLICSFTGLNFLKCIGGIQEHVVLINSVISSNCLQYVSILLSVSSSKPSH